MSPAAVTGQLTLRQSCPGQYHWVLVTVGCMGARVALLLSVAACSVPAGEVGVGVRDGVGVGVARSVVEDMVLLFGSSALGKGNIHVLSWQ